MSDELNATPMEAVPAIPEEKPGLLSTPTGKIVAIVLGIGALFIIAGIAIAIVMAVAGGQLAGQINGQIEEQATTGTTESTTTVVAVAAAGPAAEVPNSSVFTFRDIFIPLLKPLPEETAPAAPGTGDTTTGGGSTPTDNVTPTTSGVLYLDGVISENGVLKAQMRYNGTSYTLAPGERIPNSPWQVLRVSATSVTMLYGDTQVTLSVGQGITK